MIDSYEASKFKENPLIPYPVQRLEWFLKLEKRLNRVFKKAKNEKPKMTFMTLSEAMDRVEMEYPELERMNPRDKKYFRDEFTSGAAYNISFMYNWSIFKQSYKFDKNFLDMLMNNTESGEVPASVIMHNLPYAAFFIDNIITDKNGCEYRGVYVSIILDRVLEPELGLLYVENTPDSDFKYVLVPLYKNDGKLEDILYARDAEFGIKAKYEDDAVIEMSKGVLNAIIYLCSANREVEVVRKENKKKSRGKKKSKGSSTKDTITESRVGYKIGCEIRSVKKRYIAEKKDNENKDKEQGTKKAPHMRRAHYHHYWIGSKSKSEERQLIVKFIPPTFVNGEESSAIVHMVKGK